MDDCIAVGAVEDAAYVKERLAREFRILGGEGMKIKMEENSSGKVTLFSCRLVDYSCCPYKKEDVLVIFRQYIAAALSDLIVGSRESLLLRRMIRENHYYFRPEEQEIIYCLALERINKGQGQPDDCRLRRKSEVFDRMLEFIQNHDQIIIEGFIRFRLKEYTKGLEEAVEAAVDDYVLEKEYREFIRLLQYFVAIQKPRLDIVHVVLSPGGVFRLYNNQKQVIRNDGLEGIFDNLAQYEIGYEDLLFGILVSLAPRQVVFHRGKNKGGSVALEAIKSIFDGRVRECAGCALCGREGGEK